MIWFQFSALFYFKCPWMSSAFTFCFMNVFNWTEFGMHSEAVGSTAALQQESLRFNSHRERWGMGFFCSIYILKSVCVLLCVLCGIYDLHLQLSILTTADPYIYKLQLRTGDVHTVCLWSFNLVKMQMATTAHVMVSTDYCMPWLGNWLQFRSNLNPILFWISHLNASL